MSWFSQAFLRVFDSFLTKESTVCIFFSLVGALGTGNICLGQN